MECEVEERRVGGRFTEGSGRREGEGTRKESGAVGGRVRGLGRRVER